jgi:muramoyltetrapeptide carboxypeptidase LdcA involved in peptidoglycan recycling
VRERLSALSIPVAVSKCFGHGERNIALPYGVPVTLDTNAGTLSATTGAVS